jgi:hypothetical protein
MVSNIVDDSLYIISGLLFAVSICGITLAAVLVWERKSQIEKRKRIAIKHLHKLQRSSNRKKRTR